MKTFATLPVLALLCACSGRQPAADLAFVDLAARDGNFQVTFQSNLQLFELFSSNRQQRPVLSELACSLTADGDLGFEHRQHLYAKGSIETAGTTAQGGPYRFRSAVQFWRVSNDEMGSDEMLTNAELTAALEGKRTIPCIVRMTIYLSQPYYTKPMQIPVQRILAAMPAEAANATQ